MQRHRRLSATNQTSKVGFLKAEIHEEQAIVNETIIIFILIYVIMTCIHSNSLRWLELLLILRADLRQCPQINSFGNTGKW